MYIISWNNCLKTIASYMCTLQTSINANVSVLVSTWVNSVNQYSWFYRSSSSSRFYFIVYPIFFICETNILVYLQVRRIRTVAHLNIQQNGPESLGFSNGVFMIRFSLWNQFSSARTLMWRIGAHIAFPCAMQLASRLLRVLGLYKIHHSPLLRQENH